jgi:Flp pilus assembly protein TadD
MTISLSPQTEQLIEAKMKEAGVATADELVRLALRTLDQVRAEDFDELDPQTQAVIEEGLAQAANGQGRPWESVREELRTRFINK